MSFLFTSSADFCSLEGKKKSYIVVRSSGLFVACGSHPVI